MNAYAADIAMHQFLLNEGADPSRFLFVLSHADRVFPAEEWNATEKCPSCQQALSLATVTARWQPCSLHHFRYFLRCCTCRLEPSGVCVADDPRTATTGNQRGVFTYPGRNRSEQAQKHAQQTFGETIGKSFDVAVAVSVFRPGCYSFCVKPGTALSTC